MKKTLKQMLKNPDQIGAGDIVEWLNSGYDKNSKDILKLLEAYANSKTKEGYRNGYNDGIKEMQHKVYLHYGSTAAYAKP